jgi:8-hydroxy-5-deazaflavin:NADPH oxidoreductase
VRIGIIGTGKMGRALGLRWAEAGHPVLFGSRDLRKAKAIAASRPNSTQSGDFDAAAAFGEVVLYTVRTVLPSRLLREPQALSGKIVIDCNNRDLGDDSRPADFRFDAPPPIPSLAERLAADVPGARIVKAFNTMPYTVIELARDILAPHRVSVFLSSDDREAKAIVQRLAEELGFVGVDSGKLEHARLVESVADFVRLQIGPMGLGMFATILVNVLKETT